MENKKEINFLEVYKILNDRINNETNELYAVNNLFVLIMTALFIFVSTKLDEPTILLIFGVVGMLICYAWRESVKYQRKWKLWCIEEAVIIEKNIDGIEIWEKTDPEHECQKRKCRNDSLHCPPERGKSSAFMRKLYWIFGAISLASTIYGLVLIHSAGYNFCRG